MDVVASAVAVVDAQDGLAVRQQIRRGQKLANELSNDGLPPQTAADVDRETERPMLVSLEVQADVVHFRGGPVGGRACDRELEFARQVSEFRMQRRPLANDFAVRTRVVDLVLRDAGHVVRGDVANAVAARLDGMHLNGGQLRENVRDLGQLGPVELQILAGREMPETAVVAARDVAQFAQLARAQQAVRDRDAQHGRMALDVESVAEAQGPEFVVGKLPGKKPPGLVAEFRDTLIHDRLV